MIGDRRVNDLDPSERDIAMVFQNYALYPHMSVYDNMAELIRLGAYKAGSDPEVDRSIKLYPLLEAYLAQGKSERGNLVTGYQRIAEILNSAH
jgi:ABC-type sugar transport system ATPase subunit